jgi:Family of unknown function (DUF6186)
MAVRRRLLSTPESRDVTSRDLTLVVWAALGLLFVGICLLSAARPRAVATPRATVAAILSNLAGRTLLVLGWMWLGWHLFAR